MEKSSEAKPCKKQCGSLYSHRSPRAFERCSHLVEMTFAFIVTPFESAEWLRKIYKRFSAKSGRVPDLRALAGYDRGLTIESLTHEAKRMFAAL